MLTAQGDVKNCGKTHPKNPKTIDKIHQEGTSEESCGTKVSANIYINPEYRKSYTKVITKCKPC